jgi:signal peptide peptidase SppA
MNPIETTNDVRLVRVLTALLCEPWLITAEMHRTLCDIAMSHAKGGSAEAAQHALAAGMPANPAKRMFTVAGNTAILPVEGTIGRKFSSSLYSSGVTSIDVFERMLKAAAVDPEIDSIMISLDSPGGLATGIPEVAELMRQVRARKPILAFADGLTASAAYWIASQADAIYATESAHVGSIGVYLALLDSSRYAEMMGVHVELFKSGRFKGMGMPGTSLNDEQRAMLQTRVDALGVKFRSAVQSGRAREISEDAMQGQSFSVEDALSAGLIDQVTDFDAALRDAARLGKIRASRRSMA